jgi:hypothetical protein
VAAQRKARQLRRALKVCIWKYCCFVTKRSTNIVCPIPNAVKAVRGAALALGVGAGCGRIQYVTVSTLLRLGLTDVRALAGADRRRHDHQPHHQGARRQAVPRLVGSHCRQSDFRRTVGVALLVSRYPSRISPQSTGAIIVGVSGWRRKKRLANFDEPWRRTT